MPILEINILGSTIEINYQENEKEKLMHLIQQFKLRLSEFKDIKGRFSDNKIIFLARDNYSLDLRHFPLSPCAATNRLDISSSRRRREKRSYHSLQ